MNNDPSLTGIFVKSFDCPGDGLRVAVKDIFDMAGEVTGGGSRALAGTLPAKGNADIVGRIEAAGCQIIGRANMHELAYGVTGINAYSGTPTNPKYPELIPGGSSSGSAVAVAAGLVDFAIGTDTGGSIRIPAACCGIVGLKPSFGRVSRSGAVPVHSTLDCVGPFAKNVAMLEKAMGIIAPDWNNAEIQAGGRVAFIQTASDKAIASIVRTASSNIFDVTEATLSDFMEAMDAGMKIIARETWQAFGPLTGTGLVGRDVHDRLLMASKVTDEQLAKAKETRVRFTAQVDTLLEQVEALVLPAMPGVPPSLLEAADAQAVIPITANCRPFNLSGHPAIVLPVGEHKGRPVALQLVGKHGGDEALCALARQIPIFERGATQ